MKKLVFSLLTFALIMSCSKDSDNNLETTEAAFDIAKIGALSTAVPDASFDLSEKGLYRGIFVSADVSLHGEIVISIKSDTEVSALVMLTNEKRLYFNGTSLGESNYAFKSKEASFSINLSEPTNATVTGSDYNSRPIQMKLFKDINSQRVVVGLGTFAESDGGTPFSGSWDYISTSTSTITVPIPFPPFSFSYDVFDINEVIIYYDDGSTDGVMFTDNVMEPFTGGDGCLILPPDPLMPFFTGPDIVTLPIFGDTAVDEHAAFGQTSIFGANVATWSLGRSLVVNAGVLTYIDSDCEETTGGLWAWGTRSGTIIFD